MKHECVWCNTKLKKKYKELTPSKKFWWGRSDQAYIKRGRKVKPKEKGDEK